jgi:hypothetical protein
VGICLEFIKMDYGRLYVGIKDLRGESIYFMLEKW